MQLEIFEECKFYTYDAYWQEIFSNCARNKCPKGLCYSKVAHTVYVRIPPLRETIRLSSIPAEVFSVMMDVFRTKLTLQSPTDRLTTKNEIAKSSTTGSSALEGKWETIPRHSKEILLCEYVQTVSRRHNLSFDETRHLFSYIELQLLLKNVTKVDYSGNQVRKIRDLSFDEQERRFISPSAPAPSKVFKKLSSPIAGARFWKLLALYVKS